MGPPDADPLLLASPAMSPAAVAARGDPSGELGNRLWRGLEGAADDFQPIVPGLRNQHQQRRALITEADQGVSVLVHVSAGARSGCGRVLVRQALPVRRPGEAGAGAGAAGAEDLTGAWLAVGEGVRTGRGLTRPQGPDD